MPTGTVKSNAAPTNPLTILYDQDCPICIGYWTKQRDSVGDLGGRIRYFGFRERYDLLQKHNITEEQIKKEIWAITPEGNVIRGLDVLHSFDRLRGKRLGWLLTTPRPIRPFGDVLYYLVARNRFRISKLLARISKLTKWRA